MSDPSGIPEIVGAKFGALTTAQIVARLTARPGALPLWGGPEVPLFRPGLYEGRLVALQRLGQVAGKRIRLDVRVRAFGEDGQVEEIGVRRVHLVHHIKQLAGLPIGGWTAGYFVRLNRHGHQWSPLPHKMPPRRHSATQK
ncbi:hypothetical protein [Streptomyces bobili]|uniref:hypothetical protein n=1 Tax=Streptomyces bobili TaxID=67280 RepID=UPI0037110BFE